MVNKQLIKFSIIILGLGFSLGLSPSFSYSKTGPIRLIKVKIAVDEEFREHQDWRPLVRRLIIRVNQLYEANFSLSFQIKSYAFWMSGDTTQNIFELLNDLRKKVSFLGHDLVIGFTGEKKKSFHLLGGANYLRNYIVLRRNPSENLMMLTLAHELAHVFGAVDLNEPDSIMNQGRPGPKFDPFTSKIIALNRERTFLPPMFPLPRSKIDEAINLYTARKREKKKETDLNIMIAILALEKGDYSRVIQECDEALALEPKLPEAYNLKGIAYRRTNQPSKAIEEYKKVLLFQPLMPEVHYNLGLAYWHLGDEEKAIREYKKAIELDPRYAKAYANLGYIFLKKNKADEAILYCEKALELFPDLAKAQSTLAAAYLLKGNLSQAEIHCEKALQLDPFLPEAYSTRGSIHLRQGQFERALQDYNQAINLDPAYSEAWFNRGRAYLIGNNFTKAINDLNEARRLNPQDYRYWGTLGAAYLKSGDVDKAINLSLKAVELNPGYLVALLNLGSAYLSKGEVDKAWYYVKKVPVDNDEHLAEVHVLKGSIYRHEGQWLKAKEEWERALQADPQNGEALLNLANLFLERGELLTARSYYQELINLGLHQAVAYNNLAYIYYLQAEFDQAWHCLLRAEELGLNVHPEFKKEVARKRKQK